MNSLKERIEMQKTLSEIKEKILLERHQFPIVSLKDSPSLLISILMILQFIGQYDKTINEFFRSFFS
jgi:hypothetical protein